VIFVAVGEENALHPFPLLLQIPEVGTDYVDPVVIGGKRSAAVYNEHPVRVLERHAIHPNFPQTTEGNDFEVRGAHVTRRKPKDKGLGSKL
jgi:hypothetical protein